VKISEKYIILRIFPIVSNGISTGLAPIQVRRKNILKNIQEFNLLRGKNFLDLIIDFKFERIIIIIIDIIRAITPPSFLGIERRIAYANKKYHSGWIWIGVFNGLAGLKFSGSPISCGNIIDINIKNIIRIIALVESLKEKNGWNWILSMFELVPMGLFDPVTWSLIRWIITILARIIGVMKWREKNRDRVAWLIEKPPQIHSTKNFPKYGIAEIRFVITVAPQNDIWPHGRTYPKNAVIISINRIITPEPQTFEYL